VISRLALAAATIWHFWQQRNRWIFQQEQLMNIHVFRRTCFKLATEKSQRRWKSYRFWKIEDCSFVSVAAARDRARKGWARWGHGGIGSPPVRGHRQRTVPARATVELARCLCGGIVRILRRLSEPPGGRRWPPEGGPASLGGGVHDGIGHFPTE